jgi:3-isopropylmalate/(R)-2-methylmalate dehydratase small subunit
VFDPARRITGRAWKFGDSVDTNQLAGGGLVGANPSDTLRINCLRGLRPDFAIGVQSGDIVVAGQNFGCGSSRQIAVEALQLCGVQAVVAESVARIHRRNSIALAFPIFSVVGITSLAEDQDEIEIDYAAGSVRNLTRGGALDVPPFPASVLEVYAAGGISEVIRRRLAGMGFVPTAT